MKVLKFNDFLNENTNPKGIANLTAKRIKFRELDIEQWILESDVGETIHTDDHKTVLGHVEGLIEQFEIYNEDEHPDEYVTNKIALTIESVALAKTMFSIYHKFNLGVLQNYIGTFIEYKKHWQDSEKLVDVNAKTGVLED